MTEIWKRDELGFITNGMEFFHQRYIQGLSKIGDDSMEIHFLTRRITVKWPISEDRDNIFAWFQGILEEREKEETEYNRVERAKRMAALEIQNRVAGYVTGGGYCG